MCPIEDNYSTEMKRLSEIIKRYLNKYVSTRIVFAMDVILAGAASFISALLADVLVGGGVFGITQALVWTLIGAAASALFVWIFRTYRIIIRHTTLRQLARFSAVAFGQTIFVFLIYSIIFGYSAAILFASVATLLLTFTALVITRALMIIAYDMVKARLEFRRNCQNVMVYGTSVKSVACISRLQTSPHYFVVGFIKQASAQRLMISELPVCTFSDEHDFIRLMDTKSVDAILFSTKEEANKEKDRVVKWAVDHDVKILFAPPIEESAEGVPPMPIRNIDIEDLLMREEIKISMDEVVAAFRGKTVMVTGAAGSIGSELCRQLATFGVNELVLFDNAETPMHNIRLELEEKFPKLRFTPVIGDVREIPRLDYVFSKWKPQIVFQAAAYKHVPLMEENPCEAVLVNVVGSRNVADKCIEYGVEKMVMVSTDKAVNPTNIMGCTKRLAEIYVQSLGLAMEQGKVAGKTKFVTTRFGNVLGSNGSVIPRFRDQIAKGGPVTVTHPEITRFFMTIPEACRLVMEAATMTDGNQIFVFDMGESVKIDDLARRMIKLAGFTPDKDIKVEYSGLRPGEKLYEEVLSNKENTIPTDHDRIMIAKVREYNYEQATEVVDQLETLSRAVEIPDMVRLMKRTVPEFKSKNSRFEVYDKEIEGNN